MQLHHLFQNLLVDFVQFAELQRVMSDQNIHSRQCRIIESFFHRGGILEALDGWILTQAANSFDVCSVRLVMNL